MLPFAPILAFFKNRKKSIYSNCSHLLTMYNNFWEHYHLINWILWTYYVCLKPSISFHREDITKVWRDTKISIFVHIWTPFDTESPNLQFGTRFDSLDRLYILLPFIWGVNLSYRCLCSKDINMNVTLYPYFTFSTTHKKIIIFHLFWFVYYEWQPFGSAII